MFPQEGRITGLLCGSLELLLKACQGHSSTGPGGEGAGEVLFRVRSACCILERAAHLAQGSQLMLAVSPSVLVCPLLNLGYSKKTPYLGEGERKGGGKKRWFHYMLAFSNCI